MYLKDKEYLKQNKQYKEALEAMRRDVNTFAADFQDDPRLISGWGHGYFCHEDGGRLIYDKNQPLEHKCSICGRVYTDYIFSSYFVTMYRNEAVLTALKAAMLFEAYEDQKYLCIVKEIISFYADNYKYFALHAKEKVDVDVTIDVGGAGKIMPQGLNEAIIATRFINALQLVKEYLEADYLEELKAKLFAPIVELLIPQKMHIHNISVWINSAIGMMGLFFAEEGWIKEATEKPFNLYEQIEQGVTASGFWYEGSIHYNFFALEGAMSYLVFAKEYEFAVPETIKATVMHMLDAAYHYAFDNDLFPNPSDGWPNISLKTYSYVYYMGYEALGDKVLSYIKHIEASEIARGRLPLSEPYYYDNKIPMERMLFVPNLLEQVSEAPEKRRSYNFGGSNCAILRNDTFNVFLKYGHQTTSHAHPDKMNIEIMIGDKVLTKDLSNSGYASKLCNGWHRTIAAHNTCVVNGMPSDISKEGQMLQFTDTLMEAQAKPYEGVVYTRKVVLSGDKLEDSFRVEAEENSVIDWFFHFETPLEKHNLKQVPVEMFAEYDYIDGVREIDITASELVLCNDLVQMTVQVDKTMRVFLVETYNNPADKMRDTIIIRKTDREAVFQYSMTKRTC